MFQQEWPPFHTVLHVRYFTTEAPSECPRNQFYKLKIDLLCLFEEMPCSVALTTFLREEQIWEYLTIQIVVDGTQKKYSSPSSTDCNVFPFGCCDNQLHTNYNWGFVNSQKISLERAITSIFPLTYYRANTFSKTCCVLSAK